MVGFLQWFRPLVLVEKTRRWNDRDRVQMMLDAELNEVIHALQVAQRGKGLVSEASMALPSQAYQLNGLDIEKIFALV